MRRPDPFHEIQPVALRSLRGANFWSTFPVTRLDVAVGAYDEISSADVPGVTEALHRALPGLVEHRCSIGERGGFLARLRRGTYAPHIVEHVALELQGMIGHDVAYGRARGGDRPGEYTVVFEHLHEAVGRRTAEVALEAVRRAFAGTLETLGRELEELEALRGTPDPGPVRGRIACGVTGGGELAPLRAELIRRGVGDAEGIVEVAPAEVLESGLPYARSGTAVILDAEPRDVPERYRDPERARRLVGVLADAVPRDGLVVVPASDWELQHVVREARCRVAVFTAGEEVAREDARVAYAVGTVRSGRIVVECCGSVGEAGEVREGVPVEAQVAAALAAIPRSAPTAGGAGGPPRPASRS